MPLNQASTFPGAGTRGALASTTCRACFPVHFCILIENAESAPFCAFHSETKGTWRSNDGDHCTHQFDLVSKLLKKEARFSPFPRLTVEIFVYFRDHFVKYQGYSTHALGKWDVVRTFPDMLSSDLSFMIMQFPFGYLGV